MYSKGLVLLKEEQFWDITLHEKEQVAAFYFKMLCSQLVI